MSRLSYQKKAERWDVWEVSCHGPEEGNPFADHWMKGSFSCDKETVDADGFYDGDGIYKVRFMPSYEGEYTFKVTADFLEAVAESGSMLGACQIRDISYSKGWKMLKIAEAQLGIQFLERQMGGSKGGFSVLTPEGKVFLEKFRRMEAAVQAAAEAAFEKIFLEPEEEEKEDTDGREINAF